MRYGDESYWEQIYTSKPEEGLSWHQREPSLSIELIRMFASPDRSVIDIGGGSSVLAAKLIEEGYSNCSVLDISKTALDRAKARIKPAIRAKIDWRIGNVLSQPDLPCFDVWHDRAVFHFLVDVNQQAAYAALAERTVEPHGLLVLGTFSLDGPKTCSGLEVQRYDASALAKKFERGYTLRKEAHEVHSTPWGTKQPFVYVVMERRSS